MSKEKDNNVTRPIGLKNVTNPAWQETCLDISPQDSDCAKIMQMLFGKAMGFIKIGLYKKHESYPTEIVHNPKMIASIIGSRKYSRNNTVFSLGVYGSNADGTQKNIIAICGIAIDVDYHGSPDEDISSLPSKQAVDLFYGLFIEGEIIPPPTYIEYSNNFRLVYVFDAPFVIPKTSKSKRAACFKLIRRLVQVLSERIIDGDCGDWNVDKQYKTHPYVRVPESINVKWDKADFDPSIPKIETQSCETTEIHPKSVDEVQIMTDYMKTWDITELAESVLPDLPNWYDTYKANQKRSSKKTKHGNNSYQDTQSVLKQRLKDLESLQMLRWPIDSREFMVYLYRLTAVQSGMTIDESINAAQRFNKGFEQPLSSHEVLVECKPSDYIRRFRNRTLRERFGLKAKDYPNLFIGDGYSRAERYQRDKQKQIKEGKLITKKQQLEEIYNQIIALQKQGVKRKNIESALNIPHSTMTRYLNEIKTRQMLSEDI